MKDLSLTAKIKSLTEGYDNTVGSLANVSSLLYMTLDDVSWVGFYLLKNGVLELGPFQGKPACMSIPVGKGVCGNAAEKNETILVKNVHEFPGHIACDPDSKSELVIPLRKNGNVAGVLDIDSASFDRFDENDAETLGAACGYIETLL